MDAARWQHIWDNPELITFTTSSAWSDTATSVPTRDIFNEK
jgi:hypothetical protein